MQKQYEIALILSMLAIAIACILLAGCVAQENGASQGGSGDAGIRGGWNGSAGSGERGGYGARNRSGFPPSPADWTAQNLTEEQRPLLQMRQERTAQLVAACGGKAVGDQCEMNGMRRNATGICKESMGGLSCGLGDCGAPAQDGRSGIGVASK